MRAIAAKRAALEAGLARDGANFRLAGWLPHELRAVEAGLATPRQAAGPAASE
jgi:hypothetical protein